MHIECTLTKLCVDNLFTKFESELPKKGAHTTHIGTKLLKLETFSANIKQLKQPFRTMKCNRALPSHIIKQ